MNSVSIAVAKTPAGYAATFNGGEFGVATTNFDFDIGDSTHRADVLTLIEQGRCKLDDLQVIGSELFELVFREDVSALFNKIRGEHVDSTETLGIRLQVPSDWEDLPWESLYDERGDSFLATAPKYCLIRETFVVQQHDPSPVDCRTRPISMLVVIPEGSGLDVEREWNNLDLIQRKHSNRLSMTPFRGKVTPSALRKKLEEEQWDIVHFVGHGEIDEYKNFSIRLNDPDTPSAEFYVDGETFATCFAKRPPRLVVLNCCYGASANPKRSLSGAGPILLRQGVHAVVAMRYEIPDDVAIRFAESFYSELLAGNKPGRVDMAATESRTALYINKKETTIRAFITPHLFLRPNAEHLFSLPILDRRDERNGADGNMRATMKDLRVNEDLEDCIKSLEGKQSVLIIGAGIFRDGTMRGGNAPPSIGQLAARLANHSKYPWELEAKADLATDEWISAMLFPWLLQQYQRSQTRPRLIQALVEAYAGVEPPLELLKLARSGLPGAIYLPFDGLFEKALSRTNQLFRALYLTEAQVDAGTAGTLLICPTGSLNSIGSLVLTVEEHEKLHERIATMSAVIRLRLHDVIGRSTTIIGLSPRDPLLRRVATRILDVGDERMQGPTYFICSYHSQADDAYWGKYNVKWISCGLDTFFSSLGGGA